MLGGTWGTCVQAAAAQLLQLPEQKRVLETQQENSFGVGLPPPTLLCVQRFRIQVWLVVVAQRQTSNIWCPASRGHNKAAQLFVIII